MKSRLAIIFCVLFTYSGLKATHIIGGEIYYQCINPGIGAYVFTVKLYRDCYTGVPPFDDPIFVSIYDLTGNLYVQMNMALSPSDTLENNTYNFCLYAPPNICIEEAVYTSTYILPPGEYYLTYQRCCRSQGILNIPDSISSGIGFDIVIPDTNLAVCNSSPYYNNYPPTIICLDVPFAYDHSATDPDGDSLVYYLCAPNDYDSFTWGIVPNPSGPPSSNLPIGYLAPYDSSYPIMSPIDSFRIDPVTGLLTGTPTQVGRYVVAVCVSEYRNGILLSTNGRDFQFSVDSCIDYTPVVSVVSPTICAGEDATIAVQATGGTGGPFTYMWSNGYIGTSQTISGLTQDTVFYVTTSDSCAQTTSSSIVTIVPATPISFTASVSGCAPFMLAVFSASGASDIVSWYWDFGDGSNSTVPVDSIEHFYTTEGVFDVTLIATNSNGCTSTFTEFAAVATYPIPIASFLPNPQEAIISNPTILFSDFSIGGGSYLWDFGDPASGANNNSSLVQPTHTYSSEGLYLVSLIVTSPDGCLDTAYEWVAICPDLPIPPCNYVIPGVEEATPFFDIEIIPNPGNGKFELKLISSEYLEDYTIQIRGLNGSLIYSSHYDQPTKLNRTGIDISHAGKGVYFLRVEIGKETVTKRLVIF